MSALTLVMKEVDMNAEEFLNVRAYHSRCKWSGKLFDSPPLTPPSSSDDTSSVDSHSSEEEPASPTPSTEDTEKPEGQATDAQKDLTSLVVAVREYQKQPENEKKGLAITYEGRNILNLERNLLPQQWQLRSPLFNIINPYTKPKSSFRFFEKSGALEERMTTCSDCDYREPILF